MIDLGIIEKLRKLKERYKDAHPSAIDQIGEWEKQVQVLSAIDDFSNLKTTKNIVLKLRSRLKGSIVKRLIESETSEEKELKYFISLLSPKYKEEVEKLNSEIELELSE